MNSLTVVKILPLVLMLSSIMPSQVATDFESLEGKTVTWKIDYNNDTYTDGELTMENIAPLVADVQDIDDLSCTLTFNNMSEGSEVTIDGSVLNWRGIDLAIEFVEIAGETFVDIYVGVNREFYPINVTYEGQIWTLSYDIQTGLLLGMFQERKINDVRFERDYYLRVLETDAFFTSKTGAPIALWIAVIMFSIATVYSVTVTVKDKKIRKRRACFRDDCW